MVTEHNRVKLSDKFYSRRIILIPLSCPGGISDHCLAIGWGNRSPKRRYLKYFMRKLGCRFNHSPNITLNHSSFQCINKRQRNVIMKSESECRLGSRKCTLHLYILYFTGYTYMLTLLKFYLHVFFPLSPKLCLF